MCVAQSRSELVALLELSGRFDFDLYNTLTGDLVLPDVSIDDEGESWLHGFMTCSVEPDRVVDWIAGADDELTPGAWARDNIPAPGSMARGRMGFYPLGCPSVGFSACAADVDRLLGGRPGAWVLDFSYAEMG